MSQNMSSIMQIEEYEHWLRVAIFLHEAIGKAAKLSGG
jgi:hypothetical protein